MRYMFLLYSTERPEAAATDAVEAGGAASAEAARRHGDLADEARARGVLHAADPLTASLAATTVRARAGVLTIADGPSADTAEQLAGYYILECRDLDDAIEWARKMAIGGAARDAVRSVEIRPVRSA